MMELLYNKSFLSYFPCSHAPRGNSRVGVNEGGSPHTLDDYAEHSHQINGLDISANLY